MWSNERIRPQQHYHCDRETNEAITQDRLVKARERSEHDKHFITAIAESEQKRFYFKHLTVGEITKPQVRSLQRFHSHPAMHAIPPQMLH
jgi:hypothetical protein